MNDADDHERALPKNQIRHAREVVHELESITRELVREEVRIRDALKRAHEFLRSNPTPDTFLGRQRHAFVPLPDKKE
jgi:hypothetical protein